MSGHGYHWSKCPGGGSGFDFTGLLGAAVLIGVTAAVGVVVLEFLWWIIAFLAIFAAGAVIAFIWTVRTRPAREARHAAVYSSAFRELAGPAARHRELPAYAAAEIPRVEAPAIENHYHIHHHYAAPGDPAAIIRTPTERELP